MINWVDSFQFWAPYKLQFNVFSSKTLRNAAT